MNNKFCLWKQFSDEFDNSFETGCENAFVFIDGGPSENAIKFCPYCGKLIKVDNISEDKITLDDLVDVAIRVTQIYHQSGLISFYSDRTQLDCECFMKFAVENDLSVFFSHDMIDGISKLFYFEYRGKRFVSIFNKQERIYYGLELQEHE